VWTVGTATLSTPVGASSLGDYILAGLQTRQTASVLLGCAASALLALTLDGVIHLAERGVARRRRGMVVAAAGLTLALASAADHDPLDDYVEAQIHGPLRLADDVEAIVVDYDAAAFRRRFLAQWPAGSPAHASYFRRIESGPAFDPARAAR
jgi:hypothetical protein